MTPGQPQEPTPFLDTANPLLAPCAAQLQTGTIRGAPGNGGQFGVLTIRTPSTTLTVLLTAQDVRKWAAVLTELGNNMPGSGLVTARIIP